MDTAAKNSIKEENKFDEHKFMEAFFHHAPIGIIWWDEKGKIAKLNQMAYDLLNFDERFLLGKDFSILFEDCKEGESVVSQIQNGGLVVNFETKIRTALGIRHVLLNGKSLSGFGLHGAGTCYIRDIGDIKLMQEVKASSERKYLSLLSAMTDIVWTTNEKGEINTRQENWEKYTGQAWGQYKDWGWLNAIHPDDRDHIRSDFDNALCGKADSYFSHGKIWHEQTKNYRHFEIRGMPILSACGKTEEWIGTITDIHDKTMAEEQKKTAQERIEYGYYHDMLTDLPNRTYFNDYLSRRIAEDSEKQGKGNLMAALLLIDLDRFKLINESLGHSLGDRLIQHVSLRLLECLNEKRLLARIGGDEFAIIDLDLEQEEDAGKLCQQIIIAFKEPFVLDNYELFITPSIGASIYPYDGATPCVLVRNAEAALYRAKEQGRNNFQFYRPAMNARSFERLSLENTLRKALKNKEFDVYYQPQIDLKTGKICQVEALLRWHHPEMGLTLPGDFIEIAETTGLIEQIGDWVLKTSIAEIVKWHARGHKIKVAVNLSARQFKQRHLVRNIHRSIREAGFDPKYLELELTESVIMERSQTVNNMLYELKKDGICLVIDDFNTQYSSLNYIKQLPLNKLKIDKSFIKGIPFKEADAAIVNTVINLAHSLNLKVVGEGVERNEQLKFLREHKCDFVQGFLVSPALPSVKMIELLEQNRIWMPETAY
jgi:diguanylate cyclase (GGDEF)-like protein/PAS domain S-box-containing protein